MQHIASLVKEDIGQELMGLWNVRTKLPSFISLFLNKYKKHKIVHVTVYV